MFSSGWRKGAAMALATGGFALAVTGPASAQVRSVDPDRAIDGDLAGAAATPSAGSPAPAPSAPVPSAPAAVTSAAPAAAPSAPVAPARSGDTYQKDDLIGAAQGVFGKGAKGLAEAIGDILKKQGEPNAYIVGREGGGALVLGLRYGSGTLHHKVEGQRPAYWTGPSIGFDGGVNAGDAFILVYNLYDTADLFKRFAAGEGQAYLIGGFNVSYLRHKDVVLIPVRMGVGLRLGANIGYMKFSPKQNWVPF